MENLNINLKCALVALIILLFTYFYYAGKSQVTFLSLGTAVFFWAAALATLAIITMMVRILVKLAISGAIYPNFFIYLALPFLALLLVGWIVYGIVEMPMAESVTSFIGSARVFFVRHLPYIVGLALIIAAAMWLITRNDDFHEASSLPVNINIALGTVMAIMLVSVLLYFLKKIRQPGLPEKFATYKALGSPILEGSYTINPLLEADGQYLADIPQFVQENGLIIINIKYPSSNRNAPLYKSYKIDTVGNIIDSLDIPELSPDGNTILFENGFLRPQDSENWYSWVFDGTKVPITTEANKAPSSRTVKALSPDSGALEIKYFHKTAKIKYEENPKDQWRGTHYYNLIRQSDTIRFRLEGGNSNPILEYYPCPKMDFGLLRLNQKSYYIIKQRN
ncbi:hypothetical protein [Sphingobacterium multivorum]|uniref:hypothetical protein n=1 Tax=Sphingobacterium multivorum TaxID=28454 RepID=UPI0011C03CFB|nr:hypothetical protein [Sphingobacterium multivorum]QQT46088.1 hypothetical protein I6J00_05315 [Sphingobacterium multivorum]